MNIGVFDSGLGGLTVLKNLIKQLPQYNYVYLGDNARVPYGGRSPDIVYQFTKEAMEFLFRQNCQLIIIACNTASASALRKLQLEYLPKQYPNRRILGVIRPTAEAVIESKVRKTGVIATYTTINSQAFVHEFKKLNHDVEVFQQACPLLVPIIEEGEINWDGLQSILHKYLEPLKEKKIESLILGCTHYGIVKNQIENELGNTIQVIAQGPITAQKLADYLKRHPEIDNQLEQGSKRIYYVTDLNSRFANMARMFMGEQFENHHQLQLVNI